MKIKNLFILIFFLSTRSPAQNFRITNVYTDYFNGIEIIPFKNTSYVYSGTNAGTYISEADVAGQHPASYYYQFNPINYTRSYHDVMDGTVQIPSMLYSKQYDEQNRLAEYLEQSWNGYVYENYRKTIYAYQDDNLINKYLYGWALAGGWYLFAMEDYIYTDGFLTRENYKYTDGTIWLNDFQYLYTYDSLGRLASFGLQLWNEDFFREQYIYKFSYGNVQFADSVSYSIFEDTVYDLKIVSVYHYNEEGKIAQIIEKYVPSGFTTEFIYNYDVNRNISSIVKTPSDSPEYYQTTTLTWEEYHIEEHVFSGNDLHIFPNPATTELFINFDNAGNETITLHIYDVGGRLIYASATTGNQIIWNLSDASESRVPDGIYFIKILNDDKIIRTEKLAVQ